MSSVHHLLHIDFYHIFLELSIPEVLTLNLSPQTSNLNLDLNLLNTPTLTLPH